MKKYIKRAFDIVIKNSAIMQPIVLFTLFILIFTSFAGMRIITNPKFSILFSLLTLFLVSAFASGWFYTIKYAVENFKEDNNPQYMAQYNVETLKKFFSGVGEYFLTILFVIILCIVVSGFTIYLGQRLFKVSYLQIIVSGIDANAVLTNMNQIKFMLYMNLSAFILHFISLFWIPVIYFKTKNPITSFFISLKFLFKNLLRAFGLYMFLFLCFFVLNIFAYLTANIPLLPLVFFIIFLYFITYCFVSVFCFYNQICLEKTVEEMNEKDVFIKSPEEKDEK